MQQLAVMRSAEPSVRNIRACRRELPTASIPRHVVPADASKVVSPPVRDVRRIHALQGLSGRRHGVLNWRLFLEPESTRALRSTRTLRNSSHRKVATRMRQLVQPASVDCRGGVKSGGGCNGTSEPRQRSPAQTRASCPSHYYPGLGIRAGGRDSGLVVHLFVLLLLVQIAPPLAFRVVPRTHRP